MISIEEMKKHIHNTKRMILENNINNVIVGLKYIETPDCRSRLSAEMLTTTRKDLTDKLKGLLKEKESMVL